MEETAKTAYLVHSMGEEEVKFITYDNDDNIEKQQLEEVSSHDGEKEPLDCELSSIWSKDSAISSQSKSEFLSFSDSEKVETHEISGTQFTHNNNDYRVFVPKPELRINLIPTHLMRQLYKEGFHFNLMVVGSEGIGKSTLLDSLFNLELAPEETSESRHYQKVDIEVNNLVLSERGIQLKLGLMETKGFFDYEMTPNQTYRPIIDFIDEQYHKYVTQEEKLMRDIHIKDTRIHVCLYLISSTGLKLIDLVTMKMLGSKTNLIPIITKSDTLTKEEVQRLKSQIRSAIKEWNIQIYYFPTDESNTSQMNAENNCLLPFAVITSNKLVKIGDTLVRGRHYPWGTVQAFDDDTNDLYRLRDMIIRTNMLDLTLKTSQFY